MLVIASPEVSGDEATPCQFRHCEFSRSVGRAKQSLCCWKIIV